MQYKYRIRMITPRKTLEIVQSDLNTKNASSDEYILMKVLTAEVSVNIKNLDMVTDTNTYFPIQINEECVKISL